MSGFAAPARTTMPTSELLHATREVVGELAMLTTATFSETDSLLEISAPGVTKAFIYFQF